MGAKIRRYALIILPLLIVLTFLAIVLFPLKFRLGNIALWSDYPRIENLEVKNAKFIEHRHVFVNFDINNISDSPIFLPKDLVYNKYSGAPIIEVRNRYGMQNELWSRGFKIGEVGQYNLNSNESINLSIEQGAYPFWYPVNLKGQVIRISIRASICEDSNKNCEVVLTSNWSPITE